jgi:protein O-mannosyl-transferase
MDLYESMPVRSSAHKTSPLSPQSFLNRPLPVLILLSLLTALVYSNTFSVPFLFDDFRNIENNPLIKDPKNLFAVSNPRYVGFLSFALNYHFGGLDVFGYHLVNLTIHIANGFLVYTLVLLLFRATGRTPSFHDRIPWIAFVTALLFVVHPIQTQAVTYLVQRFASLVTLFYLLTVVAYLKWRLALPKGRRPYLWYGVALLSTVLAMKTKENSLTLPFMLLLVEGVFFWPIAKKKWTGLIPFLLMLPIIPLSRAVSEGNLTITEMATTISRSDYLFTQFRVVMTYLRLLILPIHQNLDYDYPIYHSLWEPAVFLSFLFLACFFALAVYLLIRPRRMPSRSPLSTHDSPLISFGILWFFLTLSVESSIIPIDDVINEHRLYLPSIGLFLSFTVGVVAGHGALKASRPFLSAPTLLVGFMGLILVLLTVAAYQRNRVWQDDLTLWKDVVNQSPGKARGHHNLGLAYWKMKRTEEALHEYQVSLSLNPYYVEAHNNLGVAYHALGRHNEAIQEYQTAIKLDPDFAPTYTNLGITYYGLGRHNEAIRAYQKTLTIDPQYAKAYYNLGITYHAVGRHNEAILAYQRVLKMNPKLAEAHYNLGVVHDTLGHHDEALREYQTAIALDPGFAPSYHNLGNLYHTLGRLEEALRAYEKAIKLDPLYVKAHNKLGVAYDAMGRYEEALREYQTAIALDPGFAPARINLGATYDALGRYEEAIRAYQAAILLDPDMAPAHTNLGLVYIKQGRITEAKAELERALKINPDDQTARRLLKSLSR